MQNEERQGQVSGGGMEDDAAAQASNALPMEMSAAAKEWDRPRDWLHDRPLTTVAPLWHTLVLVAILLGGSFLGSGSGSGPISSSGKRPGAQVMAGKPQTNAVHASKAVRYAATLVAEWLLFGFTVWGLRLRGVPLRRLLAQDEASERRFTLAEDAGIALMWWIAAIVVLALLSTGARFLVDHSETTARVISHVAPGIDAHKATRVVARLAPHSPIETVAWILLSITAGICEETIFRGYLMRQFAAYGRSVWAGVAGSSLLFGAAHGYEGIGAMLLIAAFGAMFSALAIWRRSLRTGMMAHAWHDGFTGILAGAIGLH